MKMTNNRNIQQVLTLLLFMWATVFTTLALASENKTSYSFGIVPQQSASRLAKLWGPVFAYIKKETGVKLQFQTAKNIPEFEKRLAAGEYDFAYMNPYHFTVFNSDPGYRAIAVRKGQPIKGIMVVRKDSTIKSMAELEGQTLAFPAPAAFAASVLPRAQLSRDNVAFSSKYVSSHDSVYLGVAKGLFPAGGGVKRTFNNTNPEVSKQLKVLWTSEAFTPHAIAAHPNVDEKVNQLVQKALVDMVNDPEGKTLLASLKIKNGLIAATDDDWDDVRELGLELLNRLIKQ
jgi:phosphonate transport system substrate-binding protein